MTLVCITNDIHDVPSCVARGLHDTGCQGWARRWDNDREQVVVQVGTQCEGCLPMQAHKGLLCWSCWEKTRGALDMALDMMTHLRSIEKAAQQDNAGVRGARGWVLPVPMTWRTADEMLMLLGHPAPGFPSDANVWEVEAIAERTVDAVNAEVWVAGEHGAEAAVRFYRELQRAMIHHPMHEYEHRIRNVRCPKCKQRRLLWRPPITFIEEDTNPAGQVRIVCTNKECDMELDQTSYDQTVAAEVEAVKAEIAEKKAEAQAAARAQRAQEKAEAKARLKEQENTPA